MRWVMRCLPRPARFGVYSDFPPKSPSACADPVGWSGGAIWLCPLGASLPLMARGFREVSRHGERLPTNEGRCAFSLVGGVCGKNYRHADGLRFIGRSVNGL